MVRIKRVTASTLVESIVALVLITISSAIFLLIITKLTTRNSIDIKVASVIAARNEIIGFKSTLFEGDRRYAINGLEIIVSIFPYKDHKDIREAQIRVYDIDGHLLITRRELIKSK